MAKPAENGNSNVVDFPDSAPTQVPAGMYDLAFVSFEVRQVIHNRPKLVLAFRVAGAVYMGAPIRAYYHLDPKRKQGKGRGARFAVGWKSEFLRQFVQVFDEVPPRADRVPMSRFENSVIRAKVRLVTSNMRQRKLPSKLQYPVVDELLKLAC